MPRSQIVTTYAPQLPVPALTRRSNSINVEQRKTIVTNQDDGKHEIPLGGHFICLKILKSRIGASPLSCVNKKFLIVAACSFIMC